MDEYAVSVIPLGASGRAFSFPPQRTPEFTLTVSQLQNGQAYKFTVQVGVFDVCGGCGSCGGGGGGNGDGGGCVSSGPF